MKLYFTPHSIAYNTFTDHTLMSLCMPYFYFVVFMTLSKTSLTLFSLIILKKPIFHRVIKTVQVDYRNNVSLCVYSAAKYHGHCI